MNSDSRFITVKTHAWIASKRNSFRFIGRISAFSVKVGLQPDSRMRPRMFFEDALANRPCHSRVVRMSPGRNKPPICYEPKKGANVL